MLLFPSPTPKLQGSLPSSSLGARWDCWFAQPRSALIDHEKGLIMGTYTNCTSAALRSGAQVGVPSGALRLTLGGCSVPRGRGALEDPTRPGKQQQLGQELKELMSMEQALDQLIQSCSLNFKHLTEDKANKKYPLCLGDGCQGAGPVACSHVSPELRQYLPRGLAYLHICFFPFWVAFLPDSVEVTFS